MNEPKDSKLLWQILCMTLCPCILGLTAFVALFFHMKARKEWQLKHEDLRMQFSEETTRLKAQTQEATDRASSLKRKIKRIRNGTRVAELAEKVNTLEDKNRELSAKLHEAQRHNASLEARLSSQNDKTSSGHVEVRVKAVTPYGVSLSDCRLDGDTLLGQIRNTADFRRGTLTIKAKFFNDEGVQIDTSVTTVEALSAGDTAQFEMLLVDATEIERAVIYKVTE